MTLPKLPQPLNLGSVTATKLPTDDKNKQTKVCSDNHLYHKDQFPPLSSLNVTKLDNGNKKTLKQSSHQAPTVNSSKPPSDKKMSKDNYNNSNKNDKIVLPKVFPERFTWQMDQYPRWGGEIAAYPHGKISITNSCPIDGWIVILHTLYQDNQHVREQLHKKEYEFFHEIEKLYQSGRFNCIKERFITLNSIEITNNRIDLFGNERNLFLRHIDLLYGSRQLSRCACSTCPKKERYLLSDSIPWCDPSLSIQKTIIDWMEETGSSSCTESRG